MNERKRKVWDKIEEKRESHLDFLKELVRLSQAGEEAIQNYVAERLKKLGCDIDVIRYDPRALSTKNEFADPSTVGPGDHTSVVGRLRGEKGERRLMLFAQADTMPVDKTETWQRPPFDGIIENGRFYGWGVADDLSGIAAMISAVECLLAADLKPRGELIIASTPSKLRARGIIAVLENGHKADGVVYVHPAETGVGLNEIKEATSGLLSFRITVFGRPPDTGEPGHTAFHHLAVDPIGKAWIVYQALQDLNKKRGREVHHPVLEASVGRSTNLHVAYIHCGQDNKLIRVSPECILAGSVAIPPGEKFVDVQAQISQAVADVTRADEWLREHPPQIEWLVGISGAEVSVEHPLYQITSQAIQDVTGNKPHPNPMHTASDIRNPMLFNNTPTVGIGPLGGNLTQNGSHDEWVDVDDFIKTIKVLGSIILDWCGH